MTQGNWKNMSEKFVSQLTDFLNNDKPEEALSLIKDEANHSLIEESSWSIVPAVSSHLTAEKAKCNRPLFECCVTVLNIIAETCNPSETVLEFLEQAECMEDDVKFCTILEPLGISLRRMPDKSKAIEWCVSSIRSYVEGLPLPENDSIEYSEEDEENINAIKQRLVNVWTMIILFLEPLVQESTSIQNKSDKILLLRSYLLSLLIYMLGKPFCYLHRSVVKLEGNKSLPDKVITLASYITGDLLYFIDIVSKRTKKNNQKNNQLENDKGTQFNIQETLFTSKDNMPNLCYANFYFYVITREALWEKVPQVYHPYYIFQTCAYLVYTFLQEWRNILTFKGLILMENILGKVAKHSIGPAVLELNVYSELFNAIVKVMIYCDNDKQRKKALHIFQEYIQIFNIQARYLILLHLYQTAEHSGLLSLITSIFKSSIVECLEANPPCPEFLGKNMKTLLKHACKLQHGSATDLVEISDEVITSLNLLRFLFIRDQANKTGIWNMVDMIENEYLKPLREGISLCKAHWTVKAKDLNEQIKQNTKLYGQLEMEKADATVTLTVGGETLPAMPVTEKIKVCHQAINGLDVMESILIRVNECILDNPLKQNAKD